MGQRLRRTRTVRRVHASDPIPRLKREAAVALAELLSQWGAHETAALLGTHPQRIREIRRGKLDRFSLETLIRYLTRLGNRVELRITVR
jgi:predicted XRE-type DNA-binding protein